MSDSTQSDVVVDSSPQVEEVIDNPIVEDVETEGEQPKVEADKQEDEDDDSSLPKGEIKRIAKLTRQKYEAVAEANRYKAELEQLRAQVAPKAQAPDISQFDDVESYIDAVADYKLQQKQQEATKHQATQEAAQKMSKEWMGRVEEVRKVAPDFDQVFNSVADVVLAPMTYDVIATHKKGAEIAYALGKDHSEAYRIAALSPAEQLMALGELSAKTSLPKPKAVSTASAPIKPVTGGSSSRQPPEDMDEWVKWRNDQLRQKKR